MIQRKAYAIEAAELGPRTVRVTCSTDAVDRTGEVVEQEGIDLASFKANPIILWSHNPEHPVGTATAVGVKDGKLQAEIEFAPAGLSHKADEICALVKSGIVKTVSIGFDPVNMEPMDAARPRGPQRYRRIELLEISFVSIPANPEATVVERAHKAKKEADWKVGAARDLPIEDSDSWDGPAAEASIFEHAGGDDFKPSEAKRGFLVYDAANPDEKGSYKLPIAHVVDGELKVPKGAIRAAASRLPQTDIPEDVKTAAGKVLDHYKEKAGMDEGKKEEKGSGKRRTKSATAVKGLYDIGRLAYLLNELGYAQECAEIEAALEGDASKVPGMLAEVMQGLGAALIAMTQEEVAELLADKGEDDDEPVGLDDEAVTVVLTSKTPGQRKYRAGFQMAKAAAARVKAGRKISAATADDIKNGIDMAEKSMEHHRDAMRMLSKSVSHLKGMIEPGEGDPGADGDTRETQSSGKVEDDEGSKGASVATKEHRLRVMEAMRLSAA